MVSIYQKRERNGLTSALKSAVESREWAPVGRDPPEDLKFLEVLQFSSLNYGFSHLSCYLLLKFWNRFNTYIFITAFLQKYPSCKIWSNIGEDIELKFSSCYFASILHYMRLMSGPALRPRSSRPFYYDIFFYSCEHPLCSI